MTSSLRHVEVDEAIHNGENQPPDTTVHNDHLPSSWNDIVLTQRLREALAEEHPEFTPQQHSSAKDIMHSSTRKNLESLKAAKTTRYTNFVNYLYVLLRRFHDYRDKALKLPSREIRDLPPAPLIEMLLFSNILLPKLDEFLKLIDEMLEDN